MKKLSLRGLAIVLALCWLLLAGLGVGMFCVAGCLARAESPKPPDICNVRISVFVTGHVTGPEAPFDYVQMKEYVSKDAGKGNDLAVMLDKGWRIVNSDRTPTDRVLILQYLGDECKVPAENPNQ